MKNLFQISRVKSSSLSIIRSKRVGYAPSIQARGVFKGRFVPALGIHSIYENMQKKKKSARKRVLFHSEVKIGISEKKNMTALKKILSNQNVALFYYQKIFFENHQLHNTVTNWSLIKRLLHKTFQCALTHHANNKSVKVDQADLRKKIHCYKENLEPEDASESKEKEVDSRVLAYEYESVLKRNYRTSPKV